LLRPRQSGASACGLRYCSIPMRWRIAAVVLFMAPCAAAQTPAPPPTFSSTVDVVATPAEVAKGQTLAPVEAVASRELDQFVPGAGFQGATRPLSTLMTVPNGA